MGASGVSIHAPREGCDGFGAEIRRSVKVFQFTHPGRGATTPPTPEQVEADSFNSRTPGGVRHVTLGRYLLWGLFQFTHPGRGATPAPLTALGQRKSFNSRTPGGVRQQISDSKHFILRVSIHAPREGCDSSVRDMTS